MLKPRGHIVLCVLTTTSLAVEVSFLSQHNTQAQQPDSSQPQQQPTYTNPSQPPVTTSPNPDQNPTSSGAKNQQRPYDKKRRSWLGAFVNFFEGHHEFWVALGTIIIAVFTVILGIATAFLWRATRDLVNEAKLTAERQLRAYVGIRTNRTPEIAPNFHIISVIENSGQTPAYEVHSWTERKALARPMPKGYRFEAAPALILGPRSLINPGNEQVLGSSPKNHLSEADLAAIRAETMDLYYWGEVRYRDAFGQNCYLRFRYT